MFFAYRTRRRSTVYLQVEVLEDRLTPDAVSTASLTFNNVTATPAITNAYVLDLFNDVLYRAPTPFEALAWDNMLSRGMVSGGAAFGAFSASTEFQQVVNPVLSLFQIYLNRPADVTGLRNIVTSERAGTSLAQLATNIAQGPEFIAKNGNVLALPNVAFVTFLYQKVFHLPPDPAGLGFWVNQLNQGVSRGNLLVTFVVLPETLATNPQLYAQNQVTIGYTGLWERNTDSAFAGYVNAFNSPATLGSQFLLNQHYLGVGAARNYVIGLYQGLLHRDPDPVGYRLNRQALVTQALTDTQLYQGFVQSPEFQQDIAVNPVSITVMRSYEAFLGRVPTPDELRSGVSFFNDGNSLQSYASQFLYSPEYIRNGYAQNIQHTVVLFQENWSFDSLFGLFPGVNGIANASAASQQQVTRDGVTPYTTLPPSPSVPANLPSVPFNRAPYVPPTQGDSDDPTHEFYQEQAQINNGLMNEFVAWGYYPGGATQGTNEVMSYYDSRTLPYGPLVTQYTIADNFFHSAFGGSWLNAMWLVTAAAPINSGSPPPSSEVAKLDGNGKLLLDASGAIINSGLFTPDGYPVNDINPANFPGAPGPYLPTINDTNPAGPNYLPTLGDRLNTKNINWKWYAEGWNNALAGNPSSGFEYHHLAYSYFSNYQIGAPLQLAHLQDLVNFYADLAQNTLPTVVYLKGLEDAQQPHDEHPGVGPEQVGQQWAVDQVTAVQQSASWANSSVLITYDENGGRWDHVQPPAIDRWGPGSRIPMLVISPFARKNFVDHTQYETVSIDKTLEQVYGLAALSSRDANANAMWNAYTFSATDLLKND